MKRKQDEAGTLEDSNIPEVAKQQESAKEQERGAGQKCPGSKGKRSLQEEMDLLVSTPRGHLQEKKKYNGK